MTRHSRLTGAADFANFLAPLMKKLWFVYAKEPFAVPKQMLAYQASYTFRVAISNSRLLKDDGTTVTCRVRNYRANGRARDTTMMLEVGEFIRVSSNQFPIPRGCHQSSNSNRCAQLDNSMRRRRIRIKACYCGVERCAQSER